MREARTALARLFTNLAMVTIPDDMPRPYAQLLEARDELREERRLQKGEGAADNDRNTLLSLAGGFQIGVGFVFTYVLVYAQAPWAILGSAAGAIIAFSLGVYLLKEGR